MSFRIIWLSLGQPYRIWVNRLHESTKSSWYNHNKQSKTKLCVYSPDMMHGTDFNSLASGRFQRNFRKVIIQLILVIDGSCKIVLKWITIDLIDDKSTFVQAMAWCRQATSHHLSQCWPRSLLPYGVIRPQWVKRVKVILVQLQPDIT